jgi:hypothetical protein
MSRGHTTQSLEIHANVLVFILKAMRSH